VSKSSRVDAFAAVAPSADIALLNYQPPSPRLLDLECIEIVPGQNPRGSTLGKSVFQGREFDELVESIREIGLLSPIVVRPRAGRTGDYVLVAGERRYRAVEKLGHRQINAEIVQLDDAQAKVAALAENLFRKDLSKVDRVLYSLNVIADHVNLPVTDLAPFFGRLRDVFDPTKGGKVRQASPEGPADRSDKVPLGHYFPENSVERRIDELHAPLQLPSYSSLYKTWIKYLDFTPAECQALGNGFSEGSVLSLLRLGDRPERAELLAQAITEEWSTLKVERAVTLALEGDPLPTFVPVTLRAKKLLQGPASKAINALPAEQQDAFYADMQDLLERYIKPH